MSDKLVIDFETFWDTKAGFTLRKMSMVEYVRDVRFNVFGLGYQRGNAEGFAEPGWISQKNVRNFLTGIDWANTDVIAHNAKFDGFILEQVYGVQPRRWIDTKGMSRAVLGKGIKNHSLATLAERFGLESKGIMKTDGLKELTPVQEQELASYCLHDVELCGEIYSRLAEEFPENQYEMLHRTVQMFVNPKIELDIDLLKKTAESERERKKTIFGDLQIDKAEFSSNIKFPKLLEKEGFEVPKKFSPKQKNEDGSPKEIAAIALGDPDFLDMLEGENERLRTLCEARVAAKSTLLETRSEKLARLGATGLWPFDVEYSGANQTHRYSGGSGAGGNPQNFTRGSALRQAVRAPDGSVIIVGDFANIELRLVAYLSKDPGLIEAIEQNKDLYCDFASTFYNRVITKDDEIERRFGKCLAENTLVITDHGCKAIQDITLEDKVWDGSNFVKHEGLVDNGTKETISFSGLWLTPDHPILCGVQWKEAQSVEQDENLRFLASDVASVKLSSLDTSEGREVELSASFESAIVVHQKEWWTSQISKAEERLVAPIVLKKWGQKNDTGNTLTQWPTMDIEPDYSTVYRLLSHGAIIQKIGCISITENEEYGFLTIGVPTKQSFCALFKLSPDGTSQLLKWIEPTSMADMYRATYALCLEQKTWLTVAASKISKRVYDLRNAGPNNRFSVLTVDGPVIVHNCAILGLGYGMGAAKFKKTVRLQTGQNISLEDAERAVGLYRSRYTRVPQLWYVLNSYIPLLARDEKGLFIGLPIRHEKEALVLPSGLKMRYPNLRARPGDHGTEWVYDVWTKKKSGVDTVKLYGGKVLENISQGLAGELCKEAVQQFGDYVTGLVHDEIHLIVRKGQEKLMATRLERVMSTVPNWMPRIKLKSEVGYGSNWLDAK